MTVKVKYEKGLLRPLEKIVLDEDRIYEMEIRETLNVEIPSQKISELVKLKGIISCGGDALEDTERLYEK